MRCEFKKNYIWLKIRGYEHSGLTISCDGGYPYNDPWDSGLFGIIAVSKADAIKEYGKKICTKEVREKALNCLRGEVKTLDMYYTGDVYGFQLEDPDGDVVDSCWGYFGSEYVKEVIEEAKSIADNFIAKAEKLHEERIAKVKANILILVGNTFVDGNETYRVGTTPLFGMPMIEMATVNKGRIRDDFYKEVNLTSVPEDVLANMVALIQ